MPRARREWSVLRGDIRRLLRSTNEQASYWSNELLLVLFNLSLDKRVMQLAEADEGWVTDAYLTNIVAGQPEYTLPEGVGHVKRVLIRKVSGTTTTETPLTRNERWGDRLHSRQESGSTYRIVGELLLIEPPIHENLVNGLKIEIESAPARFVADDSKLPLRFPDVMEGLLTYDTAVAALAVEQSQGELEQAYVNHLLRERAEYEAAWKPFVENRSEGRVFTPPMNLGD